MATTRTSSAGKVSFGSWESEEREHPQGCSFFCALSSAAALLGLRAHRARGFCSPKGLLFYFSRTVRECALRGIFSFSKENIPLTPPRERLRLSVSGLKDSYASGMKMPARGFAAFRAAIRFASASIIRCRSAYLVDVRSNSRLLRHSLMRRAQQCRIPHAVCRQTNITRASR